MRHGPRHDRIDAFLLERHGSACEGVPREAGLTYTTDGRLAEQPNTL